MNKKIVVITGANRGLGLATAQALAAKGYHIILTARDLLKAKAAVDSIINKGFSAEAMLLDVANDENVASFFKDFNHTYQKIDILINNAGAFFEQEIPDRNQSSLSIPADIILKALNTNTLSAYRMIYHALPIMKQQKYGRIVNISSGMGQLSEMDSGWPAYRISKTAMNAITRLFHSEIALDASLDIKINSICPGWVRTDMGGPNATRSLEEGIYGIIWAATLPKDGLSGGFFRDGKHIDW